MKCMQLQNAISVRVPGVYLGWANRVFLAFFAFNRINNLRIFSVAFSPIPTAPTRHLIDMLRLPFKSGHIWPQNPRYFLCRVALFTA